MNDRPLISIIVPIYGIERYLGICIESLVRQTYDNLEIILVDDGSPDRCPEICDLYASKDARIKVLHKPNGGLVSARKAGIRIARGELATYVDGDDWVDFAYYKRLVDQIGDADVIITSYKRKLFDEVVTLNNVIPCGEYEGSKLQYLKDVMISEGEFYRPGVTTYVWNKLFKLEMLKKYQLKVDDRITIGEDAAVTYPFLTECKKVVVTNESGYYYRQREDSMLKKSNHFEHEMQGIRILHDYLIDFFDEKTNGEKLKKSVNDFILSTCIMRSGGIKITDSLLFPYDKDFKDKEIIVVNAGTFGQQFVNRIKENDYCKIVKWVDDDYWEYRRCCLDVDPIESIGSVSFDYIVIANINGYIAKDIKTRLIGHGIDEDRIISVNCNGRKKDQLLKEYLKQK